MTGHFKPKGQQRLEVKVHHFSVDAAEAGGSATSQAGDDMTSTSIPVRALLTAPAPPTTPNIIRDTSELPSTARLLNDADLLLYAAVSCSFCVLKSRSPKERESDQLVCAQATRHKAQLVNMQEVRCYQALSACCWEWIMALHVIGRQQGFCSSCKPFSQLEFDLK